MKDLFSREIKVDSKGYFVYFGGIRYRAPKKTRKLVEGAIVSMLFCKNDCKVRVFFESGSYEFWKCKGDK